MQAHLAPLVFVFCVFLHLVAFYSIVDIYFTSKLVTNVSSIQQSASPLAQRLVLIVADGLRADKFYEPNDRNISRSPFLHDIIVRNGTWGISLTRAPTESRPAHVAILAGFFEDPASLRKLWKDNYVGFDSIFNQSRETWAWGAPDVLPFFNKDSAASHVHIYCHDYNEHPLARLDVWVFDQVKAFFSRAHNDAVLREKLHENKIIFFLHLAGIDSNGHLFNSDAKQYLDNIGVVDEGIRNLVELFNEFYDNDAKTAYVFTADHGMTAEGGHGGSSPTEVRTPIIAWGSGIRSPVNEPFKNVAERYKLSREEVLITKNWGLDDTKRVDISQIELSALMAALVGVPFPTNSVGALPLQYLSAHPRALAEIALCRARQMAQTMLTQLDYVRKHVVHTYLWHYDGLNERTVEEEILVAEELVKNRKYEEAVGKSRSLFHSFVQGLRYYQVYHRSFIYVCVVFSFVGWMTVIASFTLNNGQMAGRSQLTPGKYILPGLLILLFLFLTSYRVQWSYYVYALMPVVTWYMAKSCYRPVVELFEGFALLSRHGLLLKSFFGLLSMLALYVCVICMYYRPVISYVLAALSIMPLFTTNRKSRVLCGTWMTFCFTTAAFPLRREVVYESSDEVKVFYGSVWATAACLCILLFQKRTVTKDSIKVNVKPCSYLTVVSMFVPFLMGLLCLYKSSAFSPHFTYFFIVMSWLVPYLTRSTVQERILNIYAWQMSVYVLLSQSFDILFFVSFCTLLYTWFLLEHDRAGVTVDHCNNIQECSMSSKHCSRENGKIEISFADVRRSLIVLFFAVVAFFGLFSVSSFNHFSQRKLPFLPYTDNTMLMATLIYKIFLHYVAIGVVLCGISIVTGVHVFRYWCMMSIAMDVVSIHLLFKVKDVGSWAEIGNSIAYFGIANGFSSGLLIIFFLAKLLVVPRT